MAPISNEDILGYQVTTEPAAALVQRIMDWIAEPERRCRYFACLNPHSVEVAVEDEHYTRALREAEFLTPDGIGIVYASRMLGGSIRDRVTGTDIFDGTCKALQERGGGRMFFLGSTEDTLAAISERMRRDYPDIEVVGTFSPPFRPAFTDEDNKQMVEAINASGADVLWVGLTAPKQERWLHEHQSALQVAFAGPIGAVFDFYGGKVKRAGPLVQRLGLEWLPRLLQQPQRLWRRMGVSAPRFLSRVVAARLRGADGR
jgi:N-acetylglucosaminyldiphosphoundecaprenol N-acetyl-beta-D-mannosaminyltransferase